VRLRLELGQCGFRRRSRLRCRRCGASGRTTRQPVRDRMGGSSVRAVVPDGRGSLGSPVAAKRSWWRWFW
jgi:hypothetical protein